MLIVNHHEYWVVGCGDPSYSKVKLIISISRVFMHKKEDTWYVSLLPACDGASWYIALHEQSAIAGNK